MTNQTKTATDILTLCANYRANTHRIAYASAPQAHDTKQTTTDQLTALMEKRNDLVKALENTDLVKPMFNSIVHDLCETIAQISVYKTLAKLSDSPKDITASGAQKCAEMHRAFTFDIITYKRNDATATYSDAFDLFNIAYMEIWQYLKSTAPLTLTDTVHTDILKNGGEKNYTIFQTACKSIREYIHAWSKSDQYKKLHYVIGISDNGEQVTSAKRPIDDLTDIDANTKKAFFDKYGLTAQQQDIIVFLVNGEKPQDIAQLLNMPLRTVQDNIKKAKAKFTTASAYAEYVTAKNAEKVARAKAEKHDPDKVYSDIYAKAQERTAQALTAWQDAFHKGV